MFGWRGRLLRVDLTSGAITKELLDPNIAGSYLGGRGLGTYLLAEEARTSIAPLSAENHLIFATGPLTGTLAPNGGRFAVVTRIPPAGKITAASISGKWGPELKFAGYDAIIFEGRAAGPVYLWVKDGSAELRPASHVSGKSVAETTETLVRETDKRAIVSCIGPAGENGVGCALVVSDLFSAAGGCGTGAAMGCRNLKAVVVCGTQGFRLADHTKFLKAATEFRSWLSKRPIAAKGSLLYDSVLLADNLTWDPAPRDDVKPARTRGCFGCATSFSSFEYDGGKGFLPLVAGNPPDVLSERLKEYRSFTDLGLDFAAAKAILASQGKDTADSQAEMARKLAAGNVIEEGQKPGDSLDVDYGPCIADGYAVIPRVATGNDQDESRTCLMAVLDSVGLCPYLVAGIGMETIVELLAAATGIAFSKDEIVQAGRRISRLLRQTA